MIGVKAVSLSFAVRGGRMVSQSGRGSRSGAASAERAQIEAGLRPGARDWFPLLSWRLQQSRPVLSSFTVNDYPGGKSHVETVYGAPTFRNVLTAKGEHV